MSRHKQGISKRSLLCYHRTTDLNSGLGASSYTHHHCIAWWNILTKHLVETFLFLKDRIKHFAPVNILAQVSSLLSRLETWHCKAGILPACWYSFTCSTLNLFSTVFTKIKKWKDELNIYQIWLSDKNRSIDWMTLFHWNGSTKKGSIKPKF